MNDGMGGARPLWIADQVRNDVTMLRIVFTLVFDSSPIKGEGDSVGWFGLLVAPTCGFPSMQQCR